MLSPEPNSKRYIPPNLRQITDEEMAEYNREIDNQAKVALICFILTVVILICAVVMLASPTS